MTYDAIRDAEEFETNPIRGAIERPFVISQIVAGVREPYQLADRVFFLRHKERQGRRIAPHETALKQEWLSILRDVVQPALTSVGLRPAAQSIRAGTTQITVPAAAPSGGGDVALALRIAKRAVPGMPGVTIEALVERWRTSICPEIPLSILIAFMRYESGGRFDDATHGSARSGWTSPSFYELGLFQTPAGLHGRCTSGDWRSCQHAPPGREVPSDRSTWVRLCAAIRANPNDWTDPTTQVRVGLLDLEMGAAALRKNFPNLFPRPGSDWDLRMAVLYRFSRGGGYATSFLRSYQGPLATMPEEQRWNFLRDKVATAITIAHGRRVTIKREFLGQNVEEKMALAGRLGYVPVAGSAVTHEIGANASLSAEPSVEALLGEPATRALESPKPVVQWIGNVRISPYAVIDSRIDVAAQRAILRMAKGQPRLRADALGMLAAVKTGRLAGIFGDDLRSAAQVAAQLGTVRWKLVPPGRDAVLLAPLIGSPMIVFREGARSVPARLDPALRQAFSGLAARLAASPQRFIRPVAANPSDPAFTWLCALECALCAAAILDGVPFDEIIPCDICLACASGLN